MRTLSVIAQNSADGLYYPGYIRMDKPEKASITVQFYSLKPQEVLHENIIVVGGAAPCPNLAVGDLVLVQIQYKTTWVVLYVPGVVLELPTCREFYTKNFLVLTFTNVMMDRPRRCLVKIGQEKHDAILAYVKEISPNRNPLFRTDSDFGTSILMKRRRPYHRPMRLPSALSRPRKEVVIADNYRRVANERKAKARHLITASLVSRYNPFRHSHRKPLLRKPTSKENIDKHKTTPGQMQILRDVVNLNDDINSKKTVKKESDVKPKSNELKENKHGTTKHKQDGSVKIIVQDIEDETQKTEDSGDERKDSPTYSDDTFDSSDCDISKISEKSKDSQMVGRTPTPSRRPEGNQSPNEGSPVTQSSRSSLSERQRNRHHLSSSQSSLNSSPRTISRTSGTRTPINKQHENRRNSNISEEHSDNTSSTNRTLTNDVICNGEEVLVRWSDDGWYYFGIVVTEVGDDKYVVKDATGYRETVDKRDVLSDIQREFQVLQPGDTVIGLHPNYVFSYAPARVTDVYHNTGVAVQFYDKTTAKLPFVEVYKIRPDKYMKDTNYIQECEEKLCDTKSYVIAREDKTGFYLQCNIDCATKVNQNFFIRLPDMTFVKQSAVHIFTIESREHRLDQGCEYVLAPVNAQSTVYLPACITQYRPLCVRYCDGSVSKDLQTTQCFYLSSYYYRNAVDYFTHVQARIRAKRTEEESDIRDRYRASTWQRSSASSDVGSDGPMRPLYVTTSLDRVGSNGTLDDRSDVVDRKAAVSRNLVHNPLALEYRRIHKLRHTTVDAQHITA